MTETCRCEDEPTSVEKCEAEVVEGPRRGESVIINVEICDSCSNLVEASLPIPTYTGEENHE